MEDRIVRGGVLIDGPMIDAGGVPSPWMGDCERLGFEPAVARR